MLRDLERSDAAATVRTQTCIVGAGPAGITLARALVETGRSVCLLESGGLDFDAPTHALSDGSNVGYEYYPLQESRLRFFGGTTNIWGGRCVPLDEIDFETRSWVPHSGWPFGRGEIEPYLQKAHAQLQLGPFCYGEENWASFSGSPGFDSERLRTRFWRFDTVAERFVASRCRDLIAAPSIEVVVHANLTGIALNESRRAVRAIVAQSLNGKRLTVEAEQYVLACGGIENARLLLATGVGNEHDQVGRYFMEHPHGRLGYVRTDRPYELWDRFRKREVGSGPPLAPVVLAAPAAQARLGLLNSAVTFKLQKDPQQGPPINKKVYAHLRHQLNPSRANRRVWQGYRWLRGRLQRRISPAVRRAKAAFGTQTLSVIVRAEQAPNPNSRIKLSRTRDALGMPRAQLDWRLTELDKTTVSKLAGLLDEEFRRLNLGAVEKAAWLDAPETSWPVDATVSNHPIGGYHHMGTTRMSGDPSRGVVDADCRVHGCENLYVAGSSVFPTGGWANPTLTILALSHRLADHLAAAR